MKSLYYAIALVTALVVADDAFAGFGRYRRCNTSCATTACEAPCARPCAAPCAVKSCPTYVIEEEPICNPPVCERAVVVTEPAICHRTCHWECPPGTTMNGYEGHEEVEVVSKVDGHKRKIKTTGSGY